MTKEDYEAIDRLAARARLRDRAAFSQIVRSMMNKVVALTYRMTNDREAALDLAQDTFLAVWESLPSFRGEAGFTTWLYRIASNKALNFLKKRSLGQTKTRVESCDQASLKDAPDRHFEERLLRADFLEFMSQLPAQQRLVFELRFYEEMPFAEIARLMDKSIGTVKTHYRQAVGKLRQYAADRGWRP